MRIAFSSLLAFVLGSLPLSLLAQTPYLFEVDTTLSEIDLYVELSPAGSSESDETSARLAGSVMAALMPSTMPFSQIQVTDVDLMLHDTLDLRLDFGSTAGRLDITAPPDEIHLSLIEGGEPAMVMDTTFTQTGNTFTLSGTLDLDATGIISLGVGDTLELDSELRFDVTGSIVQTDDLLRLRLPLAIADTSDISGFPLILRIDGVIVATSTVIVTSSDDETLPGDLTLAQNYPNPFNPQTSISYTLDQPGSVTLRVYDTLGRLVATLVDGSLSAGRHEAVFDAADLPSGIYLYRLVANGQERRRTMVLLK